MKLLTLQKRATIAGLFFYIISIAYVFIDPKDNVKELNQLIEKLAVPMFGDLNLWIVLVSSILSLILYFVFYILAYRNSSKAFFTFIFATIFATLVYFSDMGPQLSSGVEDAIGTFSAIVDGIIVACLLLGKNNET